MKTNFLNFHVQALHECGEIIEMEVPRMTWYVVSQPDAIESLLKASHREIGKGSTWDNIRQMLGVGLITVEPEYWLAQRRALQPVFLRRYHEKFARQIERGAEDITARWESRADSGEVVKIALEMAQLTLRNAGQTLFGTDLTEVTPDISRKVVDVLYYLNQWNTYPPIKRFIGEFLPNTRHGRYRRDLKSLEKTAADLLAKHRASPSGEPNLLDALIQSLKEDPESKLAGKKPARYLRDQMLTFLFVAHETTAIAISWTWLLLAQHPEAEARLVQEIKDVLGDRPVTYEDLDNLPFLDCIVSESLRLYPPVWNFWRETKSPTQVGDYLLPAKSSIGIYPYIVHRHPDYWENPDQFDPDRFRPERSANRHRFAYIPFGGGPRQCLGKQTALIEAKLILAILIRKFSLRLPDKVVVKPNLSVTLLPSENLPMTIHRR